MSYDFKILDRVSYARGESRKEGVISQFIGQASERCLVISEGEDWPVIIPTGDLEPEREKETLEQKLERANEECLCLGREIEALRNDLEKRGKRIADLENLLKPLDDGINIYTSWKAV